MTQKVISEQDMDIVNESPIGPGLQLRRAREAAGLTEDEVAKSLYLTVSHVRALENDDYTNTPGLTFERGYLRAYARLINLSEDRIIDDFNRLGIPDKGVLAPGNLHDKKYSGKPRHARWLTYLVVLALSILIITWWQLQNDANREVSALSNPSVVALEPSSEPEKPKATPDKPDDLSAQHS